MVRVLVKAVLLLGAPCGGLNEKSAPSGIPDAFRVMFCGEPKMEVMVTLTCMVFPCMMVSLAGETCNVYSNNEGVGVSWGVVLGLELPFWYRFATKATISKVNAKPAMAIAKILFCESIFGNTVWFMGHHSWMLWFV